MKEELGIYIHIPFCKQKCYYCDFVSFAPKTYLQEEQETAYMEKLIQEIKMSKEILQKYNVTTVYIGGGTPSFVDSEYIGKILKELDGNISREAEVTIELNPGTVNKEKLRDYRIAGINRLSIGLQTAKKDLLEQIGRIHTYEQFEETYKMAREVGFENINVDLMIGLPNQRIQAVKDTVDLVTALEPSHISVYSLILEEGTKLYEMIERREIELPDENREREMYWYVKNRLELAGYNHYEISNYSKKGKESKHNLNCWNQEQYVGFGVASHSYLDGKRYSNTDDIHEYINIELTSLDKIRKTHENQDLEKKQKEYMLLGLRKIEGVVVSEFKRKFGENPIYLFRNELEDLIEEDLVEIDLDNIILTNKGINFANLVWEKFV